MSECKPVTGSVDADNLLKDLGCCQPALVLFWCISSSEKIIPFGGTFKHSGIEMEVEDFYIHLFVLLELGHLCMQ